MNAVQIEQWKAVIGYEGSYAVSSLGRVKSLARIGRQTYRPVQLQERILRPGLASTGYEMVVLFKPGQRTSHCIHRLVAQAFIDNPAALPEVNHKDGVKLNCTVANLEWCTCSQNTQHAYDTGLLVPYDRSTTRKKRTTEGVSK